MTSPESKPPAEMPTAESLRRAFDSREALTIGAEEELMLLDPGTRDLAPLAPLVLERAEGDARFKLELPASQLEIIAGPAPTAAAIADELRASRRDLAALANGVADLATAGVHPFAAAEGELNAGPRYDRTAAEYGSAARRQLVCALQIHIAPGSAERALAVYNALRSYLPDIAALAANAPYYEGSDTGLASIRPRIAGLLPRQGVPPPIGSWEEYAAALQWGGRTGDVPYPSGWWWELRPHPRFGTLELRVPDAQTTIAEAGAVAAVAQALIAWLGERFDAGDELPRHPSWRIAENRWRASRDGVEAEFADLDHGERGPFKERFRRLLEGLGPVAAGLGCAAELDRAAEQLSENGADRQRRVGREGGARAVADWLCERFLA